MGLKEEKELASADFGIKTKLVALTSECREHLSKKLCTALQKSAWIISQLVVKKCTLKPSVYHRLLVHSEQGLLYFFINYFFKLALKTDSSEQWKGNFFKHIEFRSGIRCLSKQIIEVIKKGRINLFGSGEEGTILAMNHIYVLSCLLDTDCSMKVHSASVSKLEPLTVQQLFFHSAFSFKSLIK